MGEKDEEILKRLDEVTTQELPEAQPITPKPKTPTPLPVVESPFTKAATKGELPPKVLSK